MSEQPSVRWFGGPSDERTQAVREREAADVAVAVRRILGEGWTVQDPVSGEPRRVRPRDIAILVRRHATVRVLERTLGDAGLPYRIESKSLVYASDEVRDLVTLLSAIDDPADEVAVVAALRHPALGCDDRALLAWRTAGGASNGPTEAVNLLIKKIKRTGHGFRNFHNYRLRSYCTAVSHGTMPQPRASGAAVHA